MRNGVEAASHWRDRSVLGDRVSFVVSSNHTNSSITSELRFNTASILFSFCIHQTLDISIEHMLTLLTFQTLPQDSGPYRCWVDFWKAATRNYKIYLHLVEQADSVRIYDGGDTEVDSEQLRRGVLLSVLCACAGDGGRAGGAGQLHAGADLPEPGRPPPALPQLAELQTPASAGQPGHQLSYYLS